MARVRAPPALPGASARFSVRNLKQHVEEKLPLEKATPEGLAPTPPEAAPALQG